MVEFEEVNKVIAVKFMGLEEGVDFGRLGEHVWEKGDENLVDTDAFVIGGCHGLVCKRCVSYYCVVHEECENEAHYTDECTLPVPNYSTTIRFRELLAKIKERYIIQLTVTDDVFCALTLKNEFRKGVVVDFSTATDTNINKAVCRALYNAIKDVE